MSMTYSIEQLIDKLYALAYSSYQADKKYVDAKIEFNRLDCIKKTIFSRILAEMDGKSIAEKERQVHVDPTWTEWLQKYNQAEEVMERARLERDKERMFFEACRSILSALRREMSTMGGDQS